MATTYANTLAPDNGAEALGTEVIVQPGMSVEYSLAYGAGNTQDVFFEKAEGSSAWSTIRSALAMDGSGDNFSGIYRNPAGNPVKVRFRSVETSGASTDESVTATIYIAQVTDPAAPFLPGVVYQVRKRFTLAQVNAGHALLMSIDGKSFRMVSASCTAIGGAAAAGTTVDILATQSAASAKLVAFAQASLTQNNLLRAGDSGAAVLAAGASFVANDASTKITVGKTGSDFTTATHFDITFSFVVD